MVNIKNAFKKVGSGIANAGKTAGKGVANAGKSAGSFAKNKVLGPIVNFFKALWKYLLSCMCLCCVLVLWQTGILSMGWAAITGVAGGMHAAAVAVSPSTSTPNSVANSANSANSADFSTYSPKRQAASS